MSQLEVPVSEMDKVIRAGMEKVTSGMKRRSMLIIFMGCCSKTCNQEPVIFFSLISCLMCIVN